MDMSLIEKFLTQTSPAVIFILGLLWVIYKVSVRWIDKHFENVTPLLERQTAAVEKLAGTAERVADGLAREQHANAIALRALWQELEAGRPVASG